MDLPSSWYFHTCHWQDCKLFQSGRTDFTCWVCTADDDGGFFFSCWQVNQDYVTISFLFNPNYYQSHWVISDRLTQQMAIFQPIAPHLFSSLSLSSFKHYYVLPPVSHLCPVPPHMSLHQCIPLEPSSSVLPTVLISISHSWCSSCPSPSVLSQDEKCTRVANPLSLSLTFAEFTVTVFVFLIKIWCYNMASLPVRWRIVCWDVSWLHGAGLCHLSHSWQAPPN